MECIKVSQVQSQVSDRGTSQDGGEASTSKVNGNCKKARTAWNTNHLQSQRPVQFPQGNRAATKTDLHISELIRDDVGQ